MSEFTLKDLNMQVGDRVLFYDNPQNPQKPSMGFMSRQAGVSTISILAFSGDMGFIEKPSVRHKDDPFWSQETDAVNWGKWGCFEQHPETKMLVEIKGLLTKAKVQSAKKVTE